MYIQEHISRSPRHSLFSRWKATAALLALILSPLCFTWADDEIENQLKFVYVDNVMTLRHFYSGEHLRFHSDGTLKGDAPVGPWTLDGKIAVTEIHLRGDLLLIKGRRIHQIFDAKDKPHDQLMTIDRYSGKDRDALEEALNNLVAEIEIELPGEKPDHDQVVSAVDKVFLTPGESMVDIVPSYWRAYFAKLEGKPSSTQELKKEPVYFIKPGGGVSAPIRTYTPEPEYSLEARKAKFQGTGVLYLVIDSSGSTRDLQIVRPLGMGLDEKAVEAVSTWKFDAAKKDGKPVAVGVDVEVSFRLY